MSNAPGVRVFPYALADVFAERALEGNMLAIFTDARGLSDAEMQALARETNLSETTFILPEDPEVERREGVRVRIFTTQEELPFAGHPTLGTAAWLYRNHPALGGAEAITLRLASGPIEVRFDRPAEGEAGVFGTMRQRDPVFGQVHNPEAVSRATGIPLADLDTSLPIQTVSTGMAFCLVPVRSLNALGRLAVPRRESEEYLAGTDAKFFYVFARAADNGNATWRARMQFYNGEDPATGSASGCAISYLVHFGLVGSGQGAVLEQGVEIGRKSRISARSFLTDGAVGSVFVGGRTIFVASGFFSLARS
jgi:trans-2,3-dihydro-3-hydroxyanthranilate isomerase